MLLSPICPDCAREMKRVPRTFFQRLMYSGMYGCPECNSRLAWYHPFLHRQIVAWRFVFSVHSHCVCCGTEDVRTLWTRDPVDPLSKQMLGRVQWLLGAPLKRCPACRVQYYDWRPALRRDRQLAVDGGRKR